MSRLDFVVAVSVVVVFATGSFFLDRQLLLLSAAAAVEVVPLRLYRVVPHVRVYE